LKFRTEKAIPSHADRVHVYVMLMNTVCALKACVDAYLQGPFLNTASVVKIMFCVHLHLFVISPIV